MALWFIAGTAGELIKIFPLINEAEQRNIPFYMLSTGQSGVNFWRQWHDFGLPPDRATSLLPSDEDLMQSQAALRWFSKAFFLSRKDMIQRVEERWHTQPSAGDCVIVHGDTLSTLIGAFYARRLGLPLVHVEAGLRSTRLLEPFPEEISRRWVSRMTDYHMAPDQVAYERLKRQYPDDHVIHTQGNTLLDAIDLVLRKSEPPKRLPEPYVVVNVHRYENLKSAERWQQIVDVILRAAETHSVLMVLHAQTGYKLEQEPETRKKLEAAGVHIEERIPFLSFIHWLDGADYVISDGGSNQEECYYLGKPCLLMRHATERSEGLGQNCLLSEFKAERIDNFLNAPEAFRRDPFETSQRPTDLIFASIPSCS